ncbi:MAG: family 16 glycosylhydrolase [Oscillospiraceae bacterium]|nr:family 16 glycosylhydrolase [Oscillospiraceae bacterium]
MKRSIKRFTALLTSVLCAMLLPLPGAAAEDSFYDDFSGQKLNTDKWLIAEKNWGGTIEENGTTVDYNGGVIAENVALHDGNLILTGYGDRYEGAVRGINRDGTRRADGRRCGGAIATKDYFGSGSYEIRARIAPELGCCSAMWTFEYEEQDDGSIVNHEIDIEFPGRDAEDDYSLSHALCTTWVTEEDYMTKSVFCGDQADGAFHTYRFDWHTGSETETPRVEYYFDGELTYTSYDYIPTNESRFWLGLWFPKYWAGTPDFDATAFEIDYVRITPFHESGDTPQHESYPEHGWADAELPRGWLLWHSYTSYDALDSRLYLRTPEGSISEISGDFVHAMNGSFGSSPERIAFMAIDRNADEWDIFLYDSGSITNLTQKSGFRNEDPKWSPDGKSIVFKRGHWDSAADGFVYDLALLDVETKAVTMLTNDRTEEAMPCFSEDGASLYYASYTDGIGSICRMDLTTGQTETIFAENGVTAYYPIVHGKYLYFTRWHSAGNRCDQIMRYDGETISPLGFDSDRYDCSDACPLSDTAMLYSSTQDGGYDLYYYDGTRSVRLTDLNTEGNDLGAAFFPQVTGDVDRNGVFDTADVVRLQKWLLAVPDTSLPDWKAADLYPDDVVDVFDLAAMKRELLGR